MDPKMDHLKLILGESQSQRGLQDPLIVGYAIFLYLIYTFKKDKVEFTALLEANLTLVPEFFFLFYFHKAYPPVPVYWGIRERYLSSSRNAIQFFTVQCAQSRTSQAVQLLGQAGQDSQTGQFFFQTLTIQFEHCRSVLD